jgi:predicted metal-dependent hydrolase
MDGMAYKSTMTSSPPYAEPYMIRTVSKAKRRVTDPKLREAIALFDGQEAQDDRLHMLFNEATGAGGPARSELEAELARDLEQNPSMRSLKWNLAY